MTHYDIKIDELKICYVADIENLMNFEAVEAGKSFGKTSLDVMSGVSITISPATACYLSVRR